MGNALRSLALIFALALSARAAEDIVIADQSDTCKVEPLVPEKFYHEPYRPHGMTPFLFKNSSTFFLAVL